MLVHYPPLSSSHRLLNLTWLIVILREIYELLVLLLSDVLVETWCHLYQFMAYLFILLVVLDVCHRVSLLNLLMHLLYLRHRRHVLHSWDWGKSSLWNSQLVLNTLLLHAICNLGRQLGCWICSFPCLRIRWLVDMDYRSRAKDKMELPCNIVCSVWLVWMVFHKKKLSKKYI